jgi:WD40 repeat protein
MDPTFWSVARVAAAGRSLVASGDRKRVRLWDPVSGEHRVLGKVAGPTLALCELRWDDRVLLASAGTDRAVHVWDPVRRREEGRLSDHPAGRINALVALSGRRLATAGDDAMIIVADVPTWQPEVVLAASDAAIQDVCLFTVDGHERLAAVGLDGVVRIWDVAGGDQLHVLAGHDCWLWAVCTVTLSGRVLLASAGDDRAIRLWDPASGELVRTLEPRVTVHTASVFDVGGGAIFALREVRTPDGVWLAAGGDFPGVWLWNPVTGEGAGWVGWAGVTDRDPECGWVRGLATYPDATGPDLITCGYDDTVKRFAVRPTPGFRGF